MQPNYNLQKDQKSQITLSSNITITDPDTLYNKIKDKLINPFRYKEKITSILFTSVKIKHKRKFIENLEKDINDTFNSNLYKDFPNLKTLSLLYKLFHFSAYKIKSSKRKDILSAFQELFIGEFQLTLNELSGYNNGVDGNATDQLIYALKECLDQYVKIVLERETPKQYKTNYNLTELCSRITKEIYPAIESTALLTNFKTIINDIELNSISNPTSIKNTIAIYQALFNLYINVVFRNIEADFVTAASKLFSEELGIPLGLLNRYNALAYDAAFAHAFDQNPQPMQQLKKEEHPVTTALEWIITSYKAEPENNNNSSATSYSLKQ